MSSQFVTERTPLAVNAKSEENEEVGSGILKSNRSKYVALLILLIVAGLVGYAATNYKGPTSNETRSKIDSLVDSSSSSSAKKPNIIWFIADDLGQSDISWHGSEISTPNIDSLAANGIELKSHYVMPLCSPSRASFLTGRHAFRLGLQSTMSDLVKPQSIAHIPSSYKTAGDYFSDLGYDTRAYGKWHVGYSKQSYTPTERGFNHHTGFYQFAIDYNTKYTLDQQYGYDWFNDKEVDWDSSDESLYTTFVLTDKIEQDLIEYSENNKDNNEDNNEDNKPLFMYIAFQNPHFLVGAPDDFESDCDSIEDEDRKAYCAHVQVLDYAVGKVIDTLKSYDLYDNSMIAFSTDNGALSLGLCGNPGSHTAAGSAYPYRGGKYTLFEGGVKTPAFLSGNLIDKKYHGTSSNTWFQAADWLPTLLHFSGSDIFFNSESLNEEIDYYGADGYDMYSALFENGDNARQVNDGYMILNLDYKDEYNGFVDSGIIYNGYKMIYNHELYLTGSCDVYSAAPYSTPFSSTINNDVTFNTNFNNLYLFDINNDPYETTDLLNNMGKKSFNYGKYKSVIDEMFEILNNEKEKGFMAQQDKTSQSDGDSSNFNGAWMPWQDESESEFSTKETSNTFLKKQKIDLKMDNENKN